MVLPWDVTVELCGGESVLLLMTAADGEGIGLERD